MLAHAVDEWGYELCECRKLVLPLLRELVCWVREETQGMDMSGERDRRWLYLHRSVHSENLEREFGIVVAQDRVRESIVPLLSLRLCKER